VTSDPLVGALLDGRYRVEARIATGGMSTVYRGLDVRLDRPVALKVMDARYAGDREFLTRFQREARAIARLKSPGLVAIYDQGNDTAHPFLVMELVTGGTLRELLRERGPMPPHAVVAVLAPVLSGLGAAHRAGLVHRDVKPENVLISVDGEVKLADFGLVRATTEAGITSTSVILGTAAYLSPEQVLGEETGPRSDVYAVGIMAFELLTGTTPFKGDSAIVIAHQHLDRDVPPPGSLIDGVPPEFDDFIARATAREPEARFSDAGAMGAELGAIAEELGLPQFQVPAPRNSARQITDSRPPVPRATRQLTLGPQEVPTLAADNNDGASARGTGPQAEDIFPPRQFAGIDIDEFAFTRQRSRRMLAFWILTVLVLTGLVATAGWSLGINVDGLFPR
jgi:serine/threonine protein kinase, bacterial